MMHNKMKMWKDAMALAKDIYIATSKYPASDLGYLKNIKDYLIRMEEIRKMISGLIRHLKTKPVNIDR